MADLARIAGASVTTVCRALKNDPGVGPETRDRILEIAASLNYCVNASARSLRLGKKKAISIVLTGPEQGTLARVEPELAGLICLLADEATVRGFELNLTRVSTAQLISLPDLLRSGRAEGLIVLGHDQEHGIWNSLADLHFPLVVWGSETPDQRYISVGGDNLNGGLIACKHLLRQGRSRVAFFGDICQAGVHQIYQGYMLAHSQAGFSADPSLLCPVAARQVLIAETLSRLTRAEPAFDAIVAASDFHAMLVIRSLISLGFSIPEQIAVTGYGDTYCADFFYPALTSINFSLESAAKQLLDCLFDQMNGQESRSTLLPARLKIRDSSMSS